jgi:hypothetical protein
MLRPQDDSRREFETWQRNLGEKMVAASKRMETDLEYRRKIQSMTR